MYKPPFQITNKMLSYSMSISEKIANISTYKILKRMPILRHYNKIKSIHSSLIIEANSLDLDQVKDIINGKTVIGPQKEIQEVINAYNAYSKIKEFNGYKEKDLLEAHKILTHLIEDRPGKYRNHGEGVLNGNKIIFVAPPEDLVPKLIKDLFKRLNKDKETPILIKSCIFHYEFVYIHPFSDGNGRTARLWQNVLLTSWNPLFEFVPIESQIKKYQSDYYKAIDTCNKNGNSNIFIEFMLKMIDETLKEMLLTLKKESKSISEKVNKLLNIMDDDLAISANEIMDRLGIKSKETLRASYLNPAIENGLIKMTIPDKPNSKNQKYYK